MQRVALLSFLLALPAVPGLAIAPPAANPPETLTFGRFGGLRGVVAK